MIYQSGEVALYFFNSNIHSMTEWFSERWLLVSTETIAKVLWIYRRLHNARNIQFSPLLFNQKKKPQAILRNCACRHTYCWYYFKKETKNQHQLEMQRTCYLGYSCYWDFCKDATNLHYSVLQISIFKVMKIDDNYIFELKSKHYSFLCYFA